MDGKCVLHLTPEDTVDDLAQWLEVCILGRALTPQEWDQLGTKTAYWWAVIAIQRDTLNRQHSRN